MKHGMASRLVAGAWVAPLLAALARRGIAGGLDLARRYPDLGPALLVCATETKRTEDIEAYAAALGEVLGQAA